MVDELGHAARRVLQAFAFVVKSVQVWQLQSEKRQISQPKHTQEVHPLHVGEREQPLYTFRLALSSSSSHVSLPTKRGYQSKKLKQKATQGPNSILHCQPKLFMMSFAGKQWGFKSN
ncbi:unnamed protein product [Linum trigynum]|uniref:Uncharacterized protein n=1 Tax=Linum trigynum TaxID=586398 RepID=A0AAV2GA15_9ROSI